MIKINAGRGPILSNSPKAADHNGLARRAWPSAHRTSGFVGRETAWSIAIACRFVARDFAENLLQSASRGTGSSPVSAASRRHGGDNHATPARPGAPPAGTANRASGTRRDRGRCRAGDLPGAENPPHRDRKDKRPGSSAPGGRAPQSHYGQSRRQTGHPLSFCPAFHE